MTIVIDPNPAHEGQPVTITVDGPGPYYWRVPGQDWQEVPLDDESGSGEITVPPGTGGEVLDVSDRDFPDPDNAEALIDSTD